MKTFIRVIKNEQGHTWGSFGHLIFQVLEDDLRNVLFQIEWQCNLDEADRRWYGKSYDINHKNREHEVKACLKYIHAIDEDESPDVCFAKLGGIQCQYDQFVSKFVPVTDVGKNYYKVLYPNGQIYGHFIAKNDDEMWKIAQGMNDTYTVERVYQELKVETTKF